MSNDNFDKMMINPAMPFKDCVNLFKEVLENNEDKIRRLKAQIFDDYKRCEYDSGKCLLNRGYYCPSMVEDIYCGNTGRRKLVKYKKKSSSEYYEYRFDENDKLNAIFNRERSRNEIIFEYKGLSVGVSCDYTFDNFVNLFTFCRYIKGKLDEYAFFTVNPDGQLYPFNHEKYIYHENSIEVFSSNHIQDDYFYRYVFYTNEGTVDSWTCEEYQKGLQRIIPWLPDDFWIHDNLTEYERRNVAEFEATVNSKYCQ